MAITSWLVARQSISFLLKYIQSSIARQKLIYKIINKRLYTVLIASDIDARQKFVHLLINHIVTAIKFKSAHKPDNFVNCTVYNGNTLSQGTVNSAVSICKRTVSAEISKRMAAFACCLHRSSFKCGRCFNIFTLAEYTQYFTSFLPQRKTNNLLCRHLKPC